MYAIIWQYGRDEIDCIGILKDKEQANKIIETIEAIQKRLGQYKEWKGFGLGGWVYLRTDPVINYFTNEEREITSWLKQDHFYDAAEFFCVSDFTLHEAPEGEFSPTIPI